MRLLTKHTSTKKFERQFTPECAAWAACGKPATWMAWSVHAVDHAERFSYCCDECRAVVERYWEKNWGVTCVCGYTIGGTIDDHLRFIRL